jgi:hypothetical protein
VSSPFLGGVNRGSTLSTNGRHDGASSLSFLEMGFWVRAIPTADRRPAGGALCSRFLQQTSIADSPYFHPHSFVEFSLRCQLDVLNLERVLPSRTRTGCRLLSSGGSVGRYQAPFREGGKIVGVE